MNFFGFLDDMWNAINFAARMFIFVFLGWAIGMFVVGDLIANNWATLWFTIISAVVFVGYIVWLADPLILFGAARSFDGEARWVWTLFWLNLCQGAYFVLVPVGYNGQTRLLGAAAIFLMTIVFLSRGALDEGWVKSVRAAMLLIAFGLTAVVCWIAWAPAPITYSMDKSGDRRVVATAKGIDSEEGLVPSTTKNIWWFLFGKPKLKPQTVVVATPAAPTPTPVQMPAPTTRRTRTAPQAATASAVTATDATVAPTEPAPKRKTASSVTKTSKNGFVFSISEVVGEADSVRCDFSVENTEDAPRNLKIVLLDDSDWHNPSSLLFDDLGNKFIAKGGRLGSQRAGQQDPFGFNVFNWLWMIETLAPDVAVPASLRFEGVPTEATKVAALQIFTSVGIALFKNLPIKREVEEEPSPEKGSP